MTGLPTSPRRPFPRSSGRGGSQRARAPQPVVRAAYDRDPALPGLLAAPYFTGALRDGSASWRRVVAWAATAGIPAPAFSASLAYYDSLRRDRLPAALIQGLRDYFGAHTYQRVDADGSFHTRWASDRAEYPA